MKGKKFLDRLYDWGYDDGYAAALDDFGDFPDIIGKLLRVRIDKYLSNSREEKLESSQSALEDGYKASKDQ